MSIGERLKEFGLERFSTLKEFAEALDMSYPNLYHYLSDKHEPGTPILLKLSELGCDINWLLTGEGNARGQPEKMNDEKIKKLEEENRFLRDQISRITALTQAVKLKKIGRKKS